MVNATTPGAGLTTEEEDAEEYSNSDDGNDDDLLLVLPPPPAVALLPTPAPAPAALPYPLPLPRPLAARSSTFPAEIRSSLPLPPSGFIESFVSVGGCTSCPDGQKTCPAATTEASPVK